jgi:hypothetical protein
VLFSRKITITEKFPFFGMESVLFFEKDYYGIFIGLFVEIVYSYFA